MSSGEGNEGGHGSSSDGKRKRSVKSEEIRSFQSGVSGLKFKVVSSFKSEMIFDKVQGTRRNYLRKSAM